MLVTAGATTADMLDRDRFEVVDMVRVSSELMALGEDDTACKTEACWLETLSRLGISFVIHADCLDVGGTRYVTLKVFNGKTRGLMAQDDYQAADAAGVRDQANSRLKSRTTGHSIRK